MWNAFKSTYESFPLQCSSNSDTVIFVYEGSIDQFLLGEEKFIVKTFLMESLIFSYCYIILMQLIQICFMRLITIFI